MKNPRSIDRLAVATAHMAQSQAAIIQGELRALRDSMSGLTRGIKAPVIRPPRTRTKTTRSSGIGGAIGIGLAALGDAGLFDGTGLGFSGSVKTGIGSFSLSSSSGNGGYNGGGGGDSGSFYTSDAQSASAQSDMLSLSQRIR